MCCGILGCSDKNTSNAKPSKPAYLTNHTVVDGYISKFEIDTPQAYTFKEVKAPIPMESAAMLNDMRNRIDISKGDYRILYTQISNIAPNMNIIKTLGANEKKQFYTMMYESIVSGAAFMFRQDPNISDLTTENKDIKFKGYQSKEFYIRFKDKTKPNPIEIYGLIIEKEDEAWYISQCYDKSDTKTVECAKEIVNSIKISKK